MKETKCDICGKEIKTNGDFIRDAVQIMFGAPDDNVVNSVDGTFTLSLHGETIKTMDLCADCAIKMADYALELSEKEKKS